jgi:hypothetical protein
VDCAVSSRFGRLCGALLALLIALAPLGAALAEPVRRGLLIGINDYAHPGVSDLRGAVNDVEMIGRILETRFGFERRNLKILTDSQATRAAILDAIDELIDATREGDAVYFHFSGHGSQAKDRDGDEEDGLDETIVAYDSRMPGIPDIVDDEIERRFAKLRTRNALLVFDSCHSGTVTRSLSPVRTRSIPRDTRDELYQGVTTRAAVAVETLPHVLMTGAPSDQEALDGPVDEGFYGLFSFALGRSLDQHGPGATPELIHQGVKQELRRIQQQLYMRPPEPQLEAPAQVMRQPLFGQLPAAAAAAEPSRRSWLATTPVDANRVRLVNGASLNARPSSRWALYPANELRFDYGAALAVGTVQSMSGADAILQIDTRSAAVPAGARAIAVAPPDPSQDLPLRIVGVTADRQSRLFAAIRSRAAGARQVSEAEFHRLSIELRGGTWRIMDAGGFQEVLSFADGPDAQVGERLASVVERSSRVMALLALDNPASDLKLFVGVQTAASAAQQQPATRDIVLVRDEPAPQYRIRRAGEPRSPANSLVLEIQVDRPAYITVVDIDTEGGVYQLFPTPYQRPGFYPDGLVPGNTLVRIPDGLAPGNAAGFYWDYSPPAGQDTIRVFAAADLATARVIRELIAAAESDSAALAQLRARLAAANVRGVRVSVDESDGASPAVPAGAAGTTSSAAGPALTGSWSAASIVLDIRE